MHLLRSYYRKLRTMPRSSLLHASMAMVCAACGGSDDSGAGTQAGAGGGGTLVGGSPSSETGLGGTITAAGQGIGGASDASGGTGSAAAEGLETGGATASAGGTSTAGSVAIGGSAVQSGGTPSTGGTNSTGGNSTSTSTGGNATSTGGTTTNTGGTNPTGGAATGDCTDTPTEQDVTCETWLEWGECDADWMVSNGWCNATCGRCVAGSGGATSTGGTSAGTGGNSSTGGTSSAGTGGDSATGGTNATGGATGTGSVFSQCRFHFGAIDSVASDSTVSELDFFTPGWMLGGSFDQEYVCDEGNPGGKYENQVPMVVAYLAAGIVKRNHDLCDCNVGGCGGGDLCEYGSQYIVQDWDTILNAYRSYSQGYAGCYGTDRPIIFKMEPDWYQYTYDSQSQPWSGADAGSRMSELVQALASSLPNSYFAIDVSPWVGPSNGGDQGAEWFSNFDMGRFTFVATSGGGTNANSDLLRDSNDMTWSGLNQVTGKPILADTGYGANGMSAGHDPNWDVASNLNERIADGVVAITQYNPDSNWGSTIASIRGQLDAPRYCP